MLDGVYMGTVLVNYYYGINLSVSVVLENHKDTLHCVLMMVLE